MEKYKLYIMLSTSIAQNNSTETSWVFDIEAENIKNAMDQFIKKTKELTFSGTKKVTMELVINN